MRTPPSEDTSDGEAQGATGEEAEGGEKDDDELRRAHERIDNEDSWVETSEDETTTVTLHAPPRTPLEGEWTGQASGGSSKPTARETKTASARCESHDHPDSGENAEMKNSPRPLEDPGDATDDGARHPVKPTEPPDNAGSARVRDGEERVDARWSRVSEAPRGRTDEMVRPGSNAGARTDSEGDEDVPWSIQDDPEDPGDSADRRDGIEVEPDGETEARRSRSIAHEDADTDVYREAGGERRDAQVESDSARTQQDVSIERERGSASALECSTTTDEENGQHTSTDDDDVPEDPPDPPDPPDEAAQRRNEPPSAELEGEWKMAASCEVRLTGSDTDASGVSNGDEDSRNQPKLALNALEHVRGRLERKDGENSPEGARDDRGDPGCEAHTSGASERIEDVRDSPRKLRKVSKRVRERSERRSTEDSPSRPREGLEDPGGETLIPGGVQSVQECARNVRNERVDGTNAPSRNTGSGGRLEVQEKSRRAEVDRDRRKVLEGAGHDGKRPKSEENQRDVETNALCRVRGPGGHRGEEVESGDVEGDREHQSDGDGIEMDGRQWRMDGATSGARHDSKRVGTKLLAGDEEGQHERRKHTTAHVPEPSTPAHEYPRRPTDHPNPPRRRGRLKTKTRRVSQTRARKSTYQAIRSRRGHIGRVGYVVYVVQGPGIVQE